MIATDLFDHLKNGLDAYHKQKQSKQQWIITQMNATAAGKRQTVADSSSLAKQQSVLSNNNTSTRIPTQRVQRLNETASDNSVISDDNESDASSGFGADEDDYDYQDYQGRLENNNFNNADGSNGERQDVFDMERSRDNLAELTAGMVIDDGNDSSSENIYEDGGGNAQPRRTV
jgi:hypothetical protein